MSDHSVPTTEFTITAGGASTVTGAEIDIPDGHDASYIVDHPAGVTVTYTVEVSNSSDERKQLGTAKWTTYSAVTIPAKSAAEVFGVELSGISFRRARLKGVFSGAASVGVETCVKDRS
jgi:hypothetical protein